MTWDRQLYFPFEGRRAEDFFALKNPAIPISFDTHKSPFAHQNVLIVGGEGADIEANYNLCFILKIVIKIMS